MMTAAWFENNEDTVGWKKMICDFGQESIVLTTRSKRSSRWGRFARPRGNRPLFESALQAISSRCRAGDHWHQEGCPDMPWLWLLHIHCMFWMWHDHQMHTLTTCAIRVQWLRMQLVVSKPGLRIKLHHHSKLQPRCISPKLLAHREVVQIGIMSELFAKWPQLQVA